jgi:GTPase SAR1 family protein
MHLVYDALNQESFEALARWLEELENYVPPEVVKIVVGNKLDKVKSSPLLSSPSSFPADR